MEDRVRRIAVWAVMGAALMSGAPKRPFSHKYHLTQVAACENCHTLATESTKASDNLLPDKSACVTCHDEVEIGAPRAVGVQKFNHAAHVKMGNAAPLFSAAVKGKQHVSAAPPAESVLAAAKDVCSGCHYGIAESENVPHEKVTRSHYPQMGDCLVCHNKIDPPDSCAKCHVAPQGGFRPVTHTAEFNDKHAGKEIPKETCAGCHGRKFTCKGCH